MRLRPKDAGMASSDDCDGDSDERYYSMKNDEERRLEKQDKLQSFAPIQLPSTSL